MMSSEIQPGAWYALDAPDNCPTRGTEGTDAMQVPGGVVIEKWYLSYGAATGSRPATSLVFVPGLQLERLPDIKTYDNVNIRRARIVPLVIESTATMRAVANDLRSATAWIARAGITVQDVCAFLQTAAQRLDESNDPETATGFDLEAFAASRGIDRKGRTDDELRREILAKVPR